MAAVPAFADAAARLPITLSEFTAAALGQCCAPDEVEGMKAFLHQLIVPAVRDGVAASRDWSTVPMPAVAAALSARARSASFPSPGGEDVASGEPSPPRADHCIDAVVLPLVAPVITAASKAAPDGLKREDELRASLLKRARSRRDAAGEDDCGEPSTVVPMKEPAVAEPSLEEKGSAADGESHDALLAVRGNSDQGKREEIATGVTPNEDAGEATEVSTKTVMRSAALARAGKTP